MSDTHTTCVYISLCGYNMYSIHTIRIKFNSFSNLFLGILLEFCWLFNHPFDNQLNEEKTKQRDSERAEEEQQKKN